MNIQTLPTQFLLYNPSSKTARDRYAGFTLMTCTPSQLAQPSPYPKYNLENVPKQPANRIIQFQGKDNRWNMPAHPIGIANFSNPAHNGSVCITFSVYNMTEHFKAVEHVLMGNEMFAHPVSVLFVSPSKHLVHDLFPPRSVKRNITIQMMCSSAVPPETPNMGIVIYMNPPMSVPPMSVPPMSVPPMSVPPMSVPPALVPTTPAPIPTQPLPKPTIKKSAEGNTLCPFVVKKLLELAILTKQNTCPITLEELTMPTDGQKANVTAMPCGHLFSNVAIQESFKTLVNRNVCPQCRTSGKPTIL